MARNKDLSIVLIGLLAAATACKAAGDPVAEDDTEDTFPATAGDQGDADGNTTPGDDDSAGGSSSGDTDDGATTADSGDDDDATDGGGDTEGDTEGVDDERTPGLVVTMSNEEGLNSIVAFSRDVEGSLEELGTFATGGMGRGGGLGSQSSIAIDDDREYVYVVNAGDDTVSSLRIHDDHLGLVDIVGTEGVRPTSLALTGDRLYVVNAVDEGSVVGFSIESGSLTPIEGGTQTLSGDLSPAPGQVAATPDGSHLIVTEKATNQILTYAIAEDGSLAAPVVNPSQGQTPFGLDFLANGAFVVSEAFGGGANPGASAASSYRVADGGALWTFSASVPSGQTAACWALVVRDEFVYTTNTGSDTLSGYSLDAQGAITLFTGDGALVDLGDEHSPIDLTKSADENYVYVLNAAADEIAGFLVEDDGKLTPVGEPVAVPETAFGLAGF